MNSKLLFLLVPVNNHINIVNFICANRCEELLEGLRTQEINLRHISRMTDQRLVNVWVDESGHKKFDRFFDPLGKIFGQILGFGGDKTKNFLMEKTKLILAKIGQNPLYA